MKKYTFVTACLTLALVCTRCKPPLQPQYLGYQNFRLEKAGLEKNILATEVKLYNPNAYNLQLKSASMDVYLNNAYLGHSSLDTLVVLPGKDTAYVPLQLQANTRDVLNQAVQLLLNPQARIRISGAVKAGRAGFFINLPINYEGMQRISLDNIR